MLNPVKKPKSTHGFNELVVQDTRLGNAKLFNKAIITPIAVSESGYIGIYIAAHWKQAESSSRLKAALIPKHEEVSEELIVVHISDVTGFDLAVDKKSGLGGAILGGLIAGGGGMVVGQAMQSGKAKAIDLLINTNNFNNPQIVVPLYRHESVTVATATSSSPLTALGKSLYGKAAGAATGSAKIREQEIQELMSQLDNLYLAHQSVEKAAPVIQQSSDADELAKFKKLLDDGVITQDEFNAKKKQILGL